jgi:hypothetical protein
MMFFSSHELVRSEHLGITIAQGVQYYEQAVLILLDATPSVSIKKGQGKHVP